MADVAELGFKVDSRDARKAADDLNRMSASAGRAESATGRLGRAAQGAGRSFAQFAAVLRRGAMIAAGFATAIAAGLAAMVRRTLASVDAQAKLARSLDASIDGLRGLQIAAADAGVSAGGLQSGIEMLTRRLGEAERAGTPAANALQRLGLTAQDLIGLDVDERMALLADRVQGLGLSASQAGDLLRQFGIRNSEMINLLRGGGDAIRAARQEVEDFGLSISEVDAAGIERANDAMSRLGRVIEVVATRLTVALAPALDATATFLNEMTKANNGWRDAAERGSERIIRSFLWVADAMLHVRRAYAVLDVANSAWMAATLTAVQAVGEAFSALSGTIDRSGFMDGLRRMAEDARASIGQSIEEMHRLMAMEMPSIGLEAALEKARQAAIDAAEAGERAGGGIADGMGEAAGAIAKARELFADLRNDMARGIQVEQVEFLTAMGRPEDAAALRHEIEQIDLIARGQGELSGQQIDYLLEQLEIQRQIRAETDAALAVDQVRQELAEGFTSDLDRRSAMYTQQMEILREALDMELITRDEYRELEMQAIVAFDEWKLERAAEHEAERLAVIQRAQDQERQMRDATLSHAVGLLQVLGRESKAAAILGIAISKGMEIARTIQTTATASMLAYASQLIPGDPTSIARAEAARARTLAMGAAQVALIAATGFAQGAGVMRGGGGGSGGGGGATGDSLQGPVAAPRAQDVTIRLDSNRTLFSRGEIEQILEGLNDALADGAQIRIAR